MHPVHVCVFVCSIFRVGTLMLFLIILHCPTAALSGNDLLALIRGSGSSPPNPSDNTSSITGMHCCHWVRFFKSSFTVSPLTQRFLPVQMRLQHQR